MAMTPARYLADINPMGIRELNPDWPPAPQPDLSERLAAVEQAEAAFPPVSEAEVGDDGEERWPEYVQSLGRERGKAAGGHWAGLDWCAECFNLRNGPHPHPLPKGEGSGFWLAGVSDNSRDLASPPRRVETLWQNDGPDGPGWYAVDDGLGIAFPPEIHDLTLDLTAQEWWRNAKALARLRVGEPWRTELPAWEREPSAEWADAQRARLEKENAEDG